jgi:hypothetical protein
VEFQDIYEDVRKKRNTFAHSVSKGERLAAINLLKMILTTLQELFAGQPWPKLRLTYLENDPTAIAYSSDHAYPLCCARWIFTDGSGERVCLTCDKTQLDPSAEDAV